MEYKLDGITVVSPMWGKRRITDRMVFSVIHQYLGHDEPVKIELVLVDDYIEGRGPNDESEYDYYLSDEFKQLYDTEHIEIRLIKNKDHKYQGESREIGFLAGKYDWFVLLDCDDMLAPNCCERYRHMINSYYADNKDTLPEKMQELACVHGLLYSFGEHGYEHNIIGESIWVQSRCYNRKFIIENDIHFPTGLSSRQAEDYPFIRKFDYAMKHDEKWEGIRVPYGTNADCQATAYWFPNDESLSRKDPHYGCHLAGWTMASSNSILDYFEQYNKKHGIEDQEDEYMKHEVLNMTIYAFYNFLKFIREVASTDYNPLKEDWESLRKNVLMLKTRLKDVFWDEIVYSDIEDMLYNVKHHSDIQFTESWLGTFYDFINTGFSYKKVDLLHMSYKQMRDYCKTLQFDAAGHEIHSKQVQAWVKRHPKASQKPKEKQGK
ncbi:MAG: hypothetical protein J6Y89_06685 [Lachnospiraceae bacterium]|nr:hypothetical protein [Lachnospiraceae bacterium]